MSGSKKYLFRREKAVLASFLALLACSAFGVTSSLLQADKPELRSLLAGYAGLEGWNQEDLAQVFEGEDLFVYIDGGAEIYLEYGFCRVLVQDFKDDEGRRLSLEIFEMASPESAYGIFSFKKSASGKPIEIGDEAQLADYYLNMWKGHFLVTLTGFDATPRTREGLLSIARFVAARIPDRQPRPTLLDLFPEEGLLEQTVKYFRGPLGLYNSYPFFTTDAFGLKRGAKADYLTGESLFLFEYPDERSCRQRLESVKDEFLRSDRYSGYREEGDIFHVNDGQGRPIYGAARRNYLVLIVKLKDIESVRKTLDRLEQRMSGERH